MFLPAAVKGNVVPWEKMPCTSMTTEVGMTMYMSNGMLTKAVGTTKPEYICMERHANPIPASTPIHVIPVTPDVIFETTASASMTSVKPGNKVTIATDALRVTGTTTDGVATVVALDGTATGSVVRVCFK